MNDKDLILKTMNDNPHKDNIYTSESLNSFILKDKNIDEIEFLIKEIIHEKPELVKVISRYNKPFQIVPTGLIGSFLDSGGFSKIEADIYEKQEIEIRKSKVDLELAEKMLKEYPKTKWIARISITIGICLSILELIKFLKQ